MDPCTLRQRLQINWWHLSTGCCWNMSIIPNEFVITGWGWFWSKVHPKFRWREKWGRQAIINRRLIWYSLRPYCREVTSQSWQIQCSWLWFARYGMAIIWFYPPINSKSYILMWGTRRSCLISSTRTEAWKSPAFIYWGSSAGWSRKNWMKSIGENIQKGNW